MPDTPALARITREAITPDLSRPDPDKIVAGNPEHRTWNLDEGNGLHCGLWQSTPGAWRVSYDQWEFVHIREGVSILTEDGGASVTLRAGDAFVIRPGFRGVWEVVETTLKDYVIRL